MKRIVAGTCAAVVGLALSGACGGGSSPATPTPTPPRATPTVAAPALGGNVTAVVPVHGASVTQASTRSPDPQRPVGVCFTANFEGLPEEGLWFRLVLDGREVTPQLTWVVPVAPNPPRACYATPAGLTAGRHSASVVVRNPLNAQEPPRKTVTWSFEVTP